VHESQALQAEMEGLRAGQAEAEQRAAALVEVSSRCAEAETAARDALERIAELERELAARAEEETQSR